MRFEPAQRLGVAEDAAAECDAIDAAILAARVGKRLRHRGHRGAAGRHAGDARSRRHRCTGTPRRRSIAAAVLLPMPTEPVRPSTIIARTRLATTVRRSAGVTSGVTPNHAAKAGRA